MNPHRTIFYEAGPPDRCTACTVLHRAQKAHNGEKNENRDDAHIWIVRQTDGSSAA